MQKHRLSGLELMLKVKEGAFPHPSMADTIPMKVVHVDKGEAEFQAMADDRHLNPMGGVHGGFAATVLDSVTGCAVHTLLGVGESYGTVDLNIKMLKPVPRNIALRAKARVIHISKRIGVSEATLTDAEGTVYAHGTATCMILREEKKSNLVTFKPAQEGREDRNDMSAKTQVR